MSGPSRIVRAGDERLIVAPKTLIVEDERDLLETCVRLLERVGHTCLTAATAPEAIHLIELERPNLVVTDFRLRTLDGLAVTRPARRLSPPVPVLFTTAYTSGEAKRQAREAGAVLFLPKPFSAADFLDAVNQALAAPLD